MIEFPGRSSCLQVEIFDQLDMVRHQRPVDGKPKNQNLEILLTHLMEGIGIALDLKGERMFVTDLGGSIYSAN